jgi:hypothetical protein
MSSDSHSSTDCKLKDLFALQEEGEFPAMHGFMPFTSPALYLFRLSLATSISLL